MSGGTVKALVVRILGVFLLGSIVHEATAQDRSTDAGLQTRWTKDVKPDQVHTEYPRPQMARPDWQSLNGSWEYALRPREVADRPQNFDGQILVPFPLESTLSGVTKQLEEKQRLWYRKKFTVPAAWANRRVFLHFGAVDHVAIIWLNGQELGWHAGGYDPFSFDITAGLLKSGENELVLAVADPTDASTQPRGKQVRQPEGIWYTSTSGIWQTVWLEPVPETHIERLELTPDVDKSLLRVRVRCMGRMPKLSVQVEAREGSRTVAKAQGGLDAPFELKIEDAKLWSPDRPFLYDLAVRLVDGNGQAVDQVDSYFGMRKIALAKGPGGVLRIHLNNKPLFMFGPLDQGFWPDGLYTAPSDEALRYDIEQLLKLGCNLARKHVKVEPDRWYYWCDKLGLLVWQDMPSGDASPPEGRKEIVRRKASAEQYEAELQRMINFLGNHPSIVVWIPFNEGWGQ